MVDCCASSGATALALFLDRTRRWLLAAEVFLDLIRIGAVVKSCFQADNASFIQISQALIHSYHARFSVCSNNIMQVMNFTFSDQALGSGVGYENFYSRYTAAAICSRHEVLADDGYQ